jgi:uncharacterized protein YyaL (SSP411 family)
MSAPNGTGRENRLARETSPYLLQHKDNPVDWWPWGPEALAEARRTNKPILLSVGYAACHWCHVMAHESFEDEATARVMNALFINVKVDREERPDIDQIYMTALHHLGEQGGWPLTMFLTPDGAPVWGSTYFPKVARYGKPAFVDVLHEVARLFREEPETIAQSRDALMARLAARAETPGRATIGLHQLDQLAMQLGNAFDSVNGGLRGAPKFPQCAMLEFLWRAGLRTGDNRFFEVVTHTLEHICEGGIYDHLGGGFSRYAVDARWLVPHFEKMLYDNAQLLDLLTLAFAHTGHPLFRERAVETVGWLTREMTADEGAFAASLDADSEGEEGKFYVWSLAEIEQALGPADAVYFATQYDVTDGGNFEGHNILNRLNGLEAESTRQPGNAPSPNPPSADQQRLAMLRGKLLEIRNKRQRPGRDDKILADWNGLMIAALAHAATIFARPDWLALAERAFAGIVRQMARGDRLGHSFCAGRLVFPGLASDFAAMIGAALALHETTGARSYLDRAVAWQAALDRHYANPANGGYFLTADDAEGLIVRPASTMDDAIPNANALAAQNLLRLAALTGDDAYRNRADTLIDGVLAGAADNLFAHIALLNAIDMRIRLAEIVVTGPDSEAFASIALKLPWLTRAILRAPSADTLPATHPAQEKLRAAAGESAAFVCVGETCSLPVTEPDAVAAAVAALAPHAIPSPSAR